MNNKLVAWINVEKRRLEWDKPILWETPTVVKLDRIPLYLHPVKELALTDEEMISIYEKDWSGIKCGLGRAVEQAILRKASEK